jgi:hypothetical protein
VGVGVLFVKLTERRVLSSSGSAKSRGLCSRSCGEEIRRFCGIWRLLHQAFVLRLNYVLAKVNRKHINEKCYSHGK